MSLRPLILTEDVQAAINEKVAFAEARRFYFADLLRIVQNPKLSPGNDSNFVLVIPLGYRCVFTIEEQLFGWVRHLSMSVSTPGKYPHEVAVEQVAKMYGFTKGMNDWFLHLEPEVQAVNVVELLEP